MQIRCDSCGRAVTVAATGVLPERCPFCQGAPVPARLGRFAIERLLAAGGMGEVYLARHRDLRSRVAIKLLPRMPGVDGDALRQRFLREAALTAALEHPGVVRLLDLDSDGDRLFLVLEFVDGRSLRSLLRDGPLPVARAVQLAIELALVLAAAHRQGIVHRDIKPENVLVDATGAVRVLDFGIAKALQGQEPLTRTGEILGTPEYMAPEQLLEAADAIDARTDVHALAVLLYELLTGRSPFQGQNLFAVLKLVESLVPPAPSSLRKDVPAALDAVVLRGLRKDPGERFGDAAAFAAALRGVQPAPAAAAARPRAVPWLAAIAAAFGLGLLVPGGHRAVPVDPVPPADERAVLRALLDSPPGEAAALRAALDAFGAADDAEALTLRGRALLRLGAFTEALHALDNAVQRGSADAATPAAAAWLCANMLLPVVVGAPDWLACVDHRRRDRLFGLGADDAHTLPDAPLPQAMRRLAAGDAAGAFALLLPAAGQPLAEPAATISLLAACRACADRATLRQELPSLRPERPGPGFRLLEASLGDRQALAAALAAYRDGLEVVAADRWLAELALTFVEAAGGAQRRDRMRAAAELAWLTGAGERAPLWCAGLRLALAPHPGFALAADEADRLLHLLGKGDAGDRPAHAAALALLHTGAQQDQEVAADLAALPDPADPALQPFVHWRRAALGADPGTGRLWRALVLLLVGRRDPGIGELRLLLGTAQEPGARLLLAVFAGERGAWETALRADFTMLDLLRPLPGASQQLDLDGPLAASGPSAEQWLPALRLAARLGNDMAPLLRHPALQPLGDEPLRSSYVRQVQGGIERR